MELLRTGKVKQVYDAGPEELLFHFTDNISVFDKIIPSQIPRKGESLARTSAFWFKMIEERGICRTHFIDLPKPNEMSVRKVDVIADPKLLTADRVRFMIPLEVICRHFVAGSLHDSIVKGRIDATDLGFAAGHKPSLGEPLPEPRVEFTTKLEPVDRKLDEKEALEISGLTVEELDEIKRTVLAIDAMIEEHVAPRGLIHADGKKEFAYDTERELMIIDTFGTPDEDRFWEKEAYENTGERVELSKEFVRQYYRTSGYHDELEAARDGGGVEPEIPGLPADLIAETTALYGSLYERVTGQDF